MPWEIREGRPPEYNRLKNAGNAPGSRWVSAMKGPCPPQITPEYEPDRPDRHPVPARVHPRMDCECSGLFTRSFQGCRAEQICAMYTSVHGKGPGSISRGAEPCPGFHPRPCGSGGRRTGFCPARLARLHRSSLPSGLCARADPTRRRQPRNS